MESNKTFRIIVIVTVSTLITILTPVNSKCTVPLGHSYVARSLLQAYPPSNPPSESESPSPAPACPPTETDIDSPAASPEAPADSTPPTAIGTDSPAASPGAPADSISPTDPPMEDSPVASPSEVTADSISPTDPPTEDSPAASPSEVPADSISPTDPPTEDSPAASPSEVPADSISPTDPPTEDSPVASPSEVTADSISPTDPPTEDSPAASPSEVPADSISPTDPPTEDSPAASPSEVSADSISPTAPSGKTLLNTPKNLLKPLLSPEIKTICGKTDFPLLCESSVSPLLTAQLKPDTSSVLVLAIQASMNATKAAIAIVEKLGAADCQELYDDAVANLEDAVNAIKARDIATVNTNLSAAMTDFGTCNDGFEESGEPNPLADVGDKLTKMVSNCLAISTLIR